MASRHHATYPERKLEQPKGASTSAPNTRAASKKGGNGIGAYTTSGSGAPANGSRSTSKGFDGPIKERTAKWPTPGPVGRGFNKLGVNVVKTRPARHGID
jgi:hypothetical protein